MSKEAVKRFIAALEALESRRNADPLVGLFAEDAEIANVLSAERGPAGAREIWTQYPGTFGEVQSSFRNVIVGEGRAALEWSTTGTSAGGAPVAYDGVSVLEIEGDRIRRLRAYFDPAALGREIRTTPKRRA